MAELLGETGMGSSPRKLPEMTPHQEIHDITSISGVSMKQYEDQLNAFRKENFQLKLRVYFLEENLGHGCPPAVQGLLEHNVRLQVEVEELKRQLSDKQALLAAAAEAIDVLENQGSISTETAEYSMNNNSNIQTETNESPKNTEKRGEKENDTYLESESAGEYLAVTVNNDEIDQLTRLKKENRKALQMIKECMKKIQQQDKQIKKLKLDKELTYAHVSDSQLEKYEGILKCKDEHIKDLENKLRQVQIGDSGNLQQLLTKRLQEMALFLDKLLSHKCVLGDEKKKLAESILEQSLALPIGLKLDESMALEDITMDESNLDISQSMRLEDLTMMFGHHLVCSDENIKHSTRKPLRSYPQVDAVSESECWSEPDRNVSLARVGLPHTGVVDRESVSDNNRYRSRRSRISFGSRTDEGKTNNQTLLEQVGDLTKYSQELEEDNKELSQKLELALQKINDIETERDDFKMALDIENSKLVEANSNIESMRNSVMIYETRIKETEEQIAFNVQLVEKLRSEKEELEVTFLESERSLRRAADEATIQASQAALERARAQNDRLRIERELEETRERLSAALDAHSQLEMELTRKIALDAENKVVEYYEGPNSEEDRPTSPDQGIDSDRLSSLEHDAVNLSPRSLYKENITLKQKLARTKATLAETLTQLNAANMMKRNAQRAICRQIHKTQGVLRRARDQFEQQNNN